MARTLQWSKLALEFILNGRTLTDEVLLTTLIQLERILNSYPLTFISFNPNDPEALTPNHLLLGHANPNMPPDVPSVNRLQRSGGAKYMQFQVIFAAWMRECIPFLTGQRKWLTGQKNLKVSDIMVLIDQDLPREIWPIRKVTRIFIGENTVV